MAPATTESITGPAWNCATLHWTGPPTREDHAQQHKSAAAEMTSGQRLAEERDGEGHADERLEVAKDSTLADFEVGKSVAAEDKGQRRAADPEVEEQQDVTHRQRTEPDGGQLEARPGQQEEQPVARAAGDDGQGVARVEDPPPEHGVGGKADRTGDREQGANGRGAEGGTGTEEDDSGDSADGDEQPGQAATAQTLAEEHRRQQRGQDRDPAVDQRGSGGAGVAEADVLAEAEEGDPG